MTVDQLGIAKPDLRNPALAVMAEALTDVENRYSGIPTMRNEMIAFGLPEPVFENRRNEFVVTFFNDSDNRNIYINEENNFKIEDKLLSYCKNPRTRAEISNYLGMKTIFYTMSKYIKPLIEKGKLRMTIPDKPKSKNQRYYSISDDK